MIWNLLIVADLCKHHYQKKCTDCEGFLEYGQANGAFLVHNCLNCKNVKFDKLEDSFKNTSEPYAGDLNKFILLLRKNIYPYKYADG